jgi:hypothetical protein
MDDGVNIYGSLATGNRLLRNTINRNGDDGVKIENASNNYVGSDVLGDGNIIHENVNNGVIVKGATATRNRIIGNLIWDNGLLGIALENGANGNAPAPTLSAAGVEAQMIVEGTLTGKANTTYRVELFAAIACDSSGAGEAEDITGVMQVTTNAAGVASFLIDSFVNYEPGVILSATATDSSGNTSAFGECITLTDTLPLNAPPGLNYAITNSVTLTWGMVGSAAIYELQIARDSGFIYTWESVEVTQSQYVYDGLQDGNYFWRVRGIDVGGTRGPWSAVQEFVVDAP